MENEQKTADHHEHAGERKEHQDKNGHHEHGHSGHDGKEKECKECKKLRDEVRHLKENVEKLAADNAGLDDQYKRKVADFDNYRKRMLRQMEEASDDANRKIVMRILPILDNFGRAIRDSEQNRDFQHLYDGLKITNSEIHRLFDDLGVKPIESVGKEFDPNLHEALLMEERDDVPFEKTVLEELEKGYMLGDMVVRHSKVKVGKKKTSDAQ